MDKIIVKDLEVYAFHGVLAEEKKLGQKFVVSLEAALDLYKAAENDSLEATVNYAGLCEDAEEFLQNNTFDLIEAAAHHLAIYILAKHTLLEKIRIYIKKPSAPIRKTFRYVAVEVERSWTKAYIGLGSNMGDKRKNIEDAISILGSENSTKVTAVSEMYVTKPLGYIQQEDFVNGAVEIRTLLPPYQLLDFLHSIETQLKRERTIHWGPRTIDLDILFYGDLLISDEKLVVPHLRMHERLFVIKPMCDIAPYITHPLLGKRMLELKAELEKTQALL
ncbi:MAG: 2-amino-4-hydroxy-6-hydroxymethyldihydropteridine diphosphokinase [Ruminiclostridium sp.]|nr:2-amino-4-hydroxy-6-hydroxymethyldihydropteridine diphosphokinase [Ruminiclostridium sp.]